MTRGEKWYAKCSKQVKNFHKKLVGNGWDWHAYIVGAGVKVMFQQERMVPWAIMFSVK